MRQQLLILESMWYITPPVRPRVGGVITKAVGKNYRALYVIP
jgi:hypothetical protein